jgi:2-methylfumaryl-CoA hydratase
MTARSAQGRLFEDFALGEVIRHATPRTVTAGDVALYLGLTGSRFVVHCAEPVARSLGHVACPVDDMLVFHLAFGKTVPDISRNAVANLGYAEVCFHRPVYVGDTLYVSSEVIGLKENQSGTTGIVYVRSEASNQKQATVLSWVRWVMLPRRKKAIALSEPQVPELSGWVSPDKLHVPTFVNYHGFDERDSGETFAWEDYTTGAYLDHRDGMTVDETEHALATRLYQNTAQVHFNAHSMATSRFGRRLVYGGHVMSIARALSHNGLANALQILAINGGTHKGPAFAGDTLYAGTTILDKFDLPGRRDVGGLRIRTWVRKNAPVALDDHGTPRADEASPIVLDWDYSVLVPRRQALKPTA